MDLNYFVMPSRAMRRRSLGDAGDRFNLTYSNAI